MGPRSLEQSVERVLSLGELAGDLGTHPLDLAGLLTGAHRFGDESAETLHEDAAEELPLGGVTDPSLNRLRAGADRPQQISGFVGVRPGEEDVNLGSVARD